MKRKLAIISILSAALIFSGCTTTKKINTDKEKTPSLQPTVEQKVNEGQTGHKINPSDSAMLQPPSMEEYLKDMNFLSDEEKRILIESDQKMAPVYKEINRLMEESDKISEEIYQKNKDLFDQEEELFSRNTELWEKLHQETQSANEAIKENVEQIKGSKVLTEEEKKIMLQTEEEIKVLQEKIEKVHREVVEATRDINAKLEKQYEKIDDEYKKYSDIWAKIEANTPNLGEDTIPYLDSGEQFEPEMGADVEIKEGRAENAGNVSE